MWMSFLQLLVNCNKYVFLRYVLVVIINTMIGFHLGLHVKMCKRLKLLWLGMGCPSQSQDRESCSYFLEHASKVVRAAMDERQEYVLMKKQVNHGPTGIGQKMTEQKRFAQPFTSDWFETRVSSLTLSSGKIVVWFSIQSDKQRRRTSNQIRRSL